MTDYVFIGIALIGIIGLVVNLWPRGEHEDNSPHASMPLVSIIVPARNEAHNIGIILSSLVALKYPNKEIIVVNDQSQDDTAAIAERYGIKVVNGVERPSGWRGKQWAAQQGADAAGGEYLLFTDADTEHVPDGLERALRFMRSKGLDMMSALPFHNSQTLWEKLLGPFHLILLAATSPYGTPRIKRVFAIGQYLLFKRESYVALGGHEVVKGDYVEDLPLANNCIARALKYGVYKNEGLFTVRMYGSLAEFVRGWRRNFRAGMKMSSRVSTIEVATYFAAATGAFQFGSILALGICLTTLVFFALIQSRYGKFSVLGPILFPFSLGLFLWISLLAAYDEALSRPLIWKNRAY